MKAIFTGSATALITPFKNGRIDWDAYEQLIEAQIQGGTKALIVAGTTGEPSTLSASEKKELLAFSAKAIRGRAAFIAGTGGNDTAAVIANSKAAEELGADACLIVTPYYNKTTQRGLYLHYEAIDREIGLPFIVYNVPSRTGLNLLPDTMRRIAELPHTAGLKDASASITQGLETMRLCPGLPVYSGSDELNYPLLACGAMGTISVVSNLFPEKLAALWNAVETGDFGHALAIHQSLAPLTAALFAQTSPIPVKAAMAMLGRASEEVRPPLFPLTDEEKARLRSVLNGYSEEVRG